MKMLTIVLFVFSANVAFANHCVSTTEADYGFVPKTICVQQIHAIGDGLAANVVGTPYSASFQYLGVKDDIEVLQATVVNAPDTVGCSDSMLQVLTLWVKTESSALEGENRLKAATLGYEYTPDTCHSPVRRNLIRYQ